MNTIEKSHWTPYFGWVFSGLISLVVTFPFCWLAALPVLSAIEASIGPTMLVRGTERITEDYLLTYALFAFIPLYGVATGYLQHLVLREKLAKTRWWILTAASGWFLAWLGLVISFSSLAAADMGPSVGYTLIAGAVLGALMGIAQWQILRTQVLHAGWWIPINILGFGVAGAIFGNMSGPLDILAIFMIPHIGTGVVLWLLLEKFSLKSLNSFRNSLT
jgi:hypothetical protein